MILSERKRWAFDQTVSELLLGPMEGLDRTKWKLYAKMQRHEKRVFSWEEGLTSLPKGKWAVAESQRGMTQDEVKCFMEVQRPEKRASSWEERLTFLPESEWAAAESQRGITQDEVKILCRGATPWKMGVLLRGKVELFTRVWVSCCWVPKKDDAENEKNDYKTDEGNKEEKYKYIFWCNF